MCHKRELKQDYIGRGKIKEKRERKLVGDRKYLYNNKLYVLCIEVFISKKYNK